MKTKNTKPRNNLVRLALFRKAGKHQKSNKAIRQAEKINSIKMIKEME